VAIRLTAPRLAAWRLSALLAAGLLLWPAAALAADGSEPSLLGALFKMLAALALCLGLLLGGLHLLRRFKLVDAVRGDGRIKVVATKALGPKRYVSVVEVAGQQLVLGVAEGGITLLTRLDGGEPPPGRRRPVRLSRLSDLDNPEEYLP
jgi:flagellar protein FliO/FliZ